MALANSASSPAPSAKNSGTPRRSISCTASRLNHAAYPGRACAPESAPGATPLESSLAVPRSASSASSRGGAAASSTAAATAAAAARAAVLCPREMFSITGTPRAWAPRGAQGSRGYRPRHPRPPPGRRPGRPQSRRARRESDAVRRHHHPPRDVRRDALGESRRRQNLAARTRGLLPPHLFRFRVRVVIVRLIRLILHKSHPGSVPKLAAAQRLSFAGPRRLARGARCRRRRSSHR